MNGIHDLGGMHGFGAVTVEPHEPVFHAPWEGRVFAMAMLAVGSGIANGDEFRHAIERLPPLRYLSAGYYGRWLAALEDLLVAAGVITAAELPGAARRGRAHGPASRREPPAAAAGPRAPRSASALAAARTLDRAPRFRVDDQVRARNLNPPGHTRLPRYVRDKQGAVVRSAGAWVYPDSHAHGRGADPQYVYTVRFEARELWGDAAEPSAPVHVDLFEPYLEHA